MTDHVNPCKDLVCSEYPKLERLNYCHGQMLSAQDFVDEQSYFLNKIALLTRCLDGYGVVCGLVATVEPEPRKTNDTNYTAPDDYELSVTCGVAVDSRGRELVLRDKNYKKSIKSLLSDADYQKFKQLREEDCLYLTIEYDSDPAGRQKLPLGGCCGDADRTIENRWCENPCIRLTFNPPASQTCDSCCKPIEDTRIWLAKIRFTGAEKPIFEWPVDNTIRRPISNYQTTRISGVNWLHTGIYEEEMAEHLLSNGLSIEFSAPIDEQSIASHTVRLDEAGKTIETNDLIEVAISDELEVNKNNPLQILQARIIPVWSERVCKDGTKHKECKKITVKVETRRLAPPLRVLVNVRSEFILDKCCQPLDGLNWGGFTDYIGWDHGAVNHPAEMLERTVREYEKRFHKPTSCSDLQIVRPPHSGNTVRGSGFQSWFYVVGNGCMQKYAAAPGPTPAT